VGEYDVYQYHCYIFFLSGGMELCNAYTELNDPVLQREAFAKQVIAFSLKKGMHNFPNKFAKFVTETHKTSQNPFKVLFLFSSPWLMAI
jgi:hypothetical protein